MDDGISRREWAVYALVLLLAVPAAIGAVRYTRDAGVAKDVPPDPTTAPASGARGRGGSSPAQAAPRPSPPVREAIPRAGTIRGAAPSAKCVGLARAWEQASLAHDLGGDPTASEASRVAELFLVWAVIRNNHTPERLMDNLCAVYPLLSPELRQNQSLSEWVAEPLGMIPVAPFPTRRPVEAVDLDFRALVTSAHVVSARFTLTAADIGSRSYLMRLLNEGGVWRVATWAPLRSQSYAPGGANAVPPQPR